MLINEVVIQPSTVMDYKFNNTCSDGFGSYWHQVKEVLKDGIKTVLVIGQGDNIVPYILSSQGLEVDTFDFIKDMNPTYFGNVLDIEKIVNKKYDCILCCEVLEHLPIDKLEGILNQLNKIAQKRIVLSLPIFGLSGYIKVKAPKYIDFSIVIAVPFYKFGRKVMSREHYWEIGSKGTGKKVVEKILSENLVKVDSYRVKEAPYHMFYILKPKV